MPCSAHGKNRSLAHMNEVCTSRAILLASSRPIPRTKCLFWPHERRQCHPCTLVWHPHRASSTEQVKCTIHKLYGGIFTQVGNEVVTPMHQPIHRIARTICLFVLLHIFEKSLLMLWGPWIKNTIFISVRQLDIMWCDSGKKSHRRRHWYFLSQLVVYMNHVVFHIFQQPVP